MTYLDEAQLEIVTVDYLRELGYEYVHGPTIAPDGEAPERADYAQVELTRRLRDAMLRINPGVPDEAIDDALRQVTRTDSPSLIVNNRAKEMREARSRGQELGLSDNEVAFYDALADNENAKEVMGDERMHWNRRPGRFPMARHRRRPRDA